MQIVADLHTHTIASTHAYSTVYEMARGAKSRGLIAIGITDHGPDMGDAPHEWHFSNLDILPRQIEGVTVIRGIEFNICPGGELDHMQAGSLKPVEFALASFHECCFEPSTKTAHTEALEAVLQDKRVNALGHPGNANYDFDKEYIISRCNQYDKLVEINSNSFAIRKGSRENCTEIARLCKKYEVPIVVDSDSHIEYRVGCVDHALAMLEDIGFPEELVVNSSRERLDTYFRGRGLHLFE
ncbi:phosphatase [Agathobaculum sp. LCP25S3_E8]|uniref:phosphatase n=1 Tax=Agathobaculum sp. LCP25S3_E8 TaxID=3438735 RepID=UPI003F927759